jgi:DNA polymerase III epsilon subunit-like protein
MSDIATRNANGVADRLPSLISGLLTKRVDLLVASVRQFEDHWLDPLRGDRVVEIGAVKLVNRSPTGQTFHRYVCQQARLPVRALSR